MKAAAAYVGVRARPNASYLADAEDEEDEDDDEQGVDAHEVDEVHRAPLELGTRARTPAQREEREERGEEREGTGEKRKTKDEIQT